MAATKKTKLVSCCLFLTLTISAELMAEIYKWTDENGKIHFGDNKNSPSESLERVDLNPTNTMDAVEVRKAEKSIGNRSDAAARIAKEEKLRKEAEYWKRNNCRSEEVFSHHGGMQRYGVEMRREVFTRNITVCDSGIPDKYSRYIY